MACESGGFVSSFHGWWELKFAGQGFSRLEPVDESLEPRNLVVTCDLIDSFFDNPFACLILV